LTPGSPIQASNIRQAQLDGEAEAVEAEIRGLTRLAFTKLQTNYDNLIDSAFTLIGALSREYLKDITRASYFLTRILRHAGIIESA
jgi:hypothetical protein